MGERMKCSKCQAANPDDAKFCIECGGSLEFRCPKCGATTPARGKFCKECGCDLAEIKAPPVDYSQPQTYTPKFLADKILSTGKSLEGERKLVTVLFADVANYTSISEKLDPEEVHQIMDGCFKVLLDEIHRYEGTIDKFTGDGVMALFGAPVAHEDHAQRACHASLAIERALEGYGEKIKKECGVEFRMRVGLNSGPVIVGSVGTNLKMDYTAVGDTVNLASRMQTMAQPGRTLAAPDTYRMARDFFKFEPLGKVRVKGKEELVEAYRLIEANRVETRLEAAIARGLTGFVGREKEMAILKESFEKAKSGSGQVVGIVGEAGVGKSRLVLELRRMLAQDEYTCLDGHCLHYGSSMPYVPLLDILRSYFDIREGEREFVIKKKMAEKVSRLDEKLKGILPLLHDLFSLKVEDEGYLKLEPQKKREKIFEAVRNLLVRESQRSPLVLAVDDLQWIDRTSDEFLNYFIGWLAGCHIQLILLYRPEYVHQWGGKSYYSQIGVEQLSTNASAELVRAMLEEGEVAPELRKVILDRAAGNPLFIEEFTHTLLENGSIQKKDHEYFLAIKPGDIHVPDTIQGIIAARMDRLEENLKRTMQVASVIGRDFAYRILHTITGMQGELKSYLMNLQGLEFIYEKSLFPELEYVFKHTLTQEVAYSSLLVKRRKELHERIGKAIEELYPDRLEEFYQALAYHYLRAKNWEKAYQYLKLSADKASRSYSNWEAFSFYKEAINILNQWPETEENKRRGIEVRLSAEGPMKVVAYPEDSLQILQEGERLSKEVGDRRSLATFYGSIGLCYSFRGDSAQGIRYSEKSFEEAQKIEDVDLAAPMGFDLCSSYTLAGQYIKTVEVADRVVSLLEKTHRESDFFGGPFDFNLYSALSAYYGHAMAWLGKFPQGEALCEKGLRFAHQVGNLYSIAFAEVMYGMLFNVKGDGKNTVRHLQEAVRYGEEGQIIPLSGMAHCGLGWGYNLLEDRQTAQKHLEMGISILRDSGLSFLLSYQYLGLGMVHFDSGDLGNAQSCWEEALKSAQTNAEKWMEGISRTCLGRVFGHGKKPQHVTAEEFILEGIEILDELRLRPWSARGHYFLGELYAHTGQKEKALETLKKAEGMFREMGMDFWLTLAQSSLNSLPK
jgi:class 3 adenylate cyclase/tetratricopeptide (TPR) repeat protein